MKRVVYKVIASAMVIGFGLGMAQADLPDTCIAEECAPEAIYYEVCCPVYTTIKPRCKGPKCTTMVKWDCWLEPCDPVFFGALPILMPIPSPTDLTPVNLQQSQLD